MAEAAEAAERAPTRLPAPKPRPKAKAVVPAPKKAPRQKRAYRKRRARTDQFEATLKRVLKMYRAMKKNK